ncbi:cell wall metabolism sensor histidine kinase WalK [Paenibacillus alvei]|uniref:histidine kinase n=1 Tax=Paenibacillus alvei TaxID=44250 RepID=A0ABT4GTL1_PAEAL|nr:MULTISPECIES: cell wall metabolism sensor histidine kinase WalK [Paenibacillus]MCY7487338.1 cell wall metabolism sensor histidine kinase WalK [Paenibacillus alvei]MCY9542152.1 cell wall metabolism sensor histidine kinase WalK [Paenibacillus alvei]MCY9703596.1 cell wall metabolism sensor histidine kinase WalK [Paenibacillus alvei]MCY9732477.1 cell wall metabolism sensor histidine kinase WalK [Paenibacillus alvei]MCY9754465.1 cell wall metabolism sensor histidine kinase WalK [Paenibacillus al
MKFWRSIVGKLWMTIIGLVAFVLIILGLYLLHYIDSNFAHPNDIKQLFVYTAIIGFSLTTFFAFFLFTKITQPLRKLKQAADTIRQGDYSTRVTLRSSDEIGELSRTFNHMAEELNSTILDLQHEKEHLASILRSMTDAVITFDAAGQVLLANPHGESVMSRWNGMDWALEEETAEASGVPEPLRPIFHTVISEAREVTTRVHVKQQVWSVVMGPLHADSRVRGAVAVLRDVTEEVQLEKLRKDFVANVSHEIRTPLSMLQGYSEALLDDIATSPEERRELVQVIHDESLRMGRLVKDLLDLARMEAGHLPMHKAQTDVHELASRVYRKFAVLAKERNIPIEVQLEAMDSVLPEADEDRLEQVLTNLLDNALRHSSEGQPIHIRTERTDNEWLWIHIEDHGQGIPSEDVPYVFERFYKADKARKRGPSGGTGLGLAIVKNIIEAHQGHIRVDSTLGKGTTFSIALPVQPVKSTN